MKKRMLIALVTAFSLLAFGASCFAGNPNRSVANTSKKGSLLIFPLIQIGAKDSQDTIISITNDYTSSVKIQCLYKYPDNCACNPFDFFLTANQSLAFSAKTALGIDGKALPKVGLVKPNVSEFDPGQGYTIGELKCWAVNGSGNPISFNWLSGEAIIGEDDNRSWEYSAWRFAVGYGIQNTKTLGGGHTLALTGTPTTYDACPQRLIFDIMEQVEDPSLPTYPIGPSGVQTVDNRITLIPCKQDCAGTDTLVRAKLYRYDEYENSRFPFTCFDYDNRTTAFFSKSLSGQDELKTQIYNYWHFTHLYTPGGMVVVDTDLQDSAACPSGSGFPDATYGIPVLGVMSKRFHGVGGPIAGDTPTVHGPAQPQVTDINGNPVGDVTISY